MLRMQRLQQCISHGAITRLSTFMAGKSHSFTPGGRGGGGVKQLQRTGRAADTTRLYATEAVLAQEEPVVVRVRAGQKKVALEIDPSSNLAVPAARQRRTKSTRESTTEASTTASRRKKKLLKEDTQTTTVILQEEGLKVAEETVFVKKTRARKPRKEETSLVTVVESPPPVKTELRPYQQECIDACLKNLEDGIKRQIVSLPVGSGKTVIFSHLMKQVPEPFPGARKTLILAHRQELLEQTRAHVLRNGTGLTATIDQGKRIGDMDADVIIASVPTLGRAGTPRLLKYDPKEFKCIIIDEAHHAAADSYTRILEHFGAHTPDTHIFVYGCSATVRRHDGVRLGGAFDHISFHKGFITMIEDKWLCGLRVSTIKTDFDLRDVKMQAGDFSQKELSVKINDPVRNDIIVRSFMTYCAERKSTVVFAVDIAHLEELTEVFRKYGYDARGLSSKTDDIERAQLLKDFRERKFPIIVNCGILTEGTDIPVIDCVLMARPTKSNVLFLQMLGRGMRLYPGKEDCLVLDFVDVVKGEGLVTLPTLLGLEMNAVLDKTAVIKSQEDVDAIRDENIAALEAQGDGSFADRSSQFPDETRTETVTDPVTGHKVARIRVLQYDNPYQLIGDCSGIPRRVWDMSLNAWVNVGPDAFVLTFKTVTFKIERSKEDGLFRCQRRTTMEKSDSERAQWKANLKSFGRRKMTDEDAGDGGGKRGGLFKTKASMLPIESDTLQDCLHGVDTWIAKNIGHFPQILGRNAAWRNFPASESQLKFLRKLGYDHDSVLDDIVDDMAKRDKPADGDVHSAVTTAAADLTAFNRMQKLKAQQKPLKKGQAANMITRLLNGAGKQWAESKKFKIRRAKDLAKEIGVDVGPIPKYVDV